MKEANMSTDGVGDHFGVLERLYTEEQRLSVLRGTRAAEALARAEIAKRGRVHLVSGEIYAGDHPIAGDTEIVDLVKEETGFGCTIFQGNMRIATNAVAGGGVGRATGTRTNEEITEKVFRRGEMFLGVTRTIGKDWMIRYSPLRTEEGDIVGMIATYFEQTAFMEGLALFRSRIADAAEAARLAEQQSIVLKRQNKELERSNRMRDEFLANMSHELRTPLNAVLGYCESLQLGVYGSIAERQEKAIASIERSGEHLLRLINDLLDLSRIDSGQERLQTETVQISELCRSSLELVSEQAAHKGLVIDLEIETKRTSLEADPRRLKQVLVNLLSNAMKFTNEGSIGLRVRDSPEKETIEFEVRDTGIGIDPKFLEMVFEPFVQAESGDTRRYPGTGLGLALVKRLVELHGGRIELASVIGKGSKFTVHLPVSAASHPEKGPAEPSAARKSREPQPPHVPPIRSNRRLILLVEDDLPSATYIRDFLEYKGFRVVHAGNGLDGIERTRALRPDLVLMDVQMPVLDGLSATRRLRADPETRDVKIIALTARALPRDQEECLEAGADGYLAKPVVLKVLLNNIREILGE
jgi:signal transduction histidine kinase/CheY-like chemotaxis protein